jgi:hypothetical protein
MDEKDIQKNPDFKSYYEDLAYLGKHYLLGTTQVGHDNLSSKIDEIDIE